MRTGDVVAEVLPALCMDEKIGTHAARPAKPAATVFRGHPLSRYFLIVIAFAVSVTTARAADSAFVIHLEGMAALCHITGRSGMLEASSIKRRLGAQNQKYKAQVEKSFTDAQSCVVKVKEETKSMFRDQVSAHPALRQQLTDAYAAWLGLMDWLRIPREFGEEAPGQHEYEAAINRLRAEFEAM